MQIKVTQTESDCIICPQKGIAHLDYFSRPNQERFQFQAKITDKQPSIVKPQARPGQPQTDCFWAIRNQLLVITFPFITKLSKLAITVFMSRNKLWTDIDSASCELVFWKIRDQGFSPGRVTVRRRRHSQELQINSLQNCWSSGGACAVMTLLNMFKYLPPNKCHDCLSRGRSKWGRQTGLKCSVNGSRTPLKNDWRSMGPVIYSQGRKLHSLLSESFFSSF